MQRHGKVTAVKMKTNSIRVRVDNLMNLNAGTMNK